MELRNTEDNVRHKLESQKEGKENKFKNKKKQKQKPVNTNKKLTGKTTCATRKVSHILTGVQYAQNKHSGYIAIYMRRRWYPKFLSQLYARKTLTYSTADKDHRRRQLQSATRKYSLFSYRTNTICSYHVLNHVFLHVYEEEVIFLGLLVLKLHKSSACGSELDLHARTDRYRSFAIIINYYLTFISPR